MNHVEDSATGSVEPQQTGLSHVLVVVHAVIGFAFILLDPGLSMVQPELAAVVGFRAAFPLLPCLGLFWVLIAAALISCRRTVLVLTIVAHAVALTASMVLGLLGLFLIWPTDQPAGHGLAGLATAIGFLFIGLSILIGVAAVATIIGLLIQIRRRPPARKAFSMPAIVLAALGVVTFSIHLAWFLSIEAAQAQRNARIARTVAHESGVGAVEFSPDGKLLASGSSLVIADRFLRIWDIESGSMVRQLSVDRSVSSLAWSHDGEWLIVGCGEKSDSDASGAVQIWNTGTWERLHEFETSYVTAVAVSRDSQFVAAAVSESRHDDGRTVVFLYHLPDLEVIGFGDVPDSSSIGVPGNRIVSVIFTPDGRRLLAGGGTRIVSWNLLFQHDAEPNQIITMENRITGMKITPLTDRLICVSSGTGLVHQLNSDDLQQVAAPLSYQLWALHSHQPMVCCTDDRVIVAESQAPLVKCLSLLDGAEQFAIPLESTVTAIDLSLDATVLALGVERRLRLYNGQTGEFLREMIRP